MLTEPNGLVLRCAIYTRASDKEIGGPGHKENVVYKLMEGGGALHNGNSLFMDNYHKSVCLIHELLEENVLNKYF